MNRHIRFSAVFLSSACLLFLAALLLIYPPRADLTVSMEFSSDTAGYIQLFVNDGQGFREELTAYADVHGDGKSQTCELHVPLRTGFYALRLDPLHRPATLYVSAITVRFQDKTIAFAGEELLKWQGNGQVSSALQADKTLQMDLSGRDSQILWITPAYMPFSRIQAVRHNLPHYLLLLLLSLCIGFVFAAILRPGPSPVSLFRGDPLRNIRDHGARWGLVALFYLLCLCFAFYPLLFQSRQMITPASMGLVPEKPHNPLHLVDPDAGAYIEAPGLAITHDSLLRGELPLYNRYEGCGSPYLANGEVAATSLVQLPLHLLASDRAWDIFALARMLVAALFACLWLLGIGFSLPVALFAGLAWGFSGIFSLFANLVHLNGTLVLPLMLLATEALLYKRSWLRICLLAAAFALAVNCGNPQPAVVALLVIVLRVIGRRFGTAGWRPWLKQALPVGFALLLGLLLSAVTWLPLAEFMSKSYHRPGTIVKHIPATELLSLALPPSPDRCFRLFPLVHGFIGITSVIAALGGLLFLAQRRKGELLVYGGILLLLLAILFVQPVRALVLHHVPVLQQVIFFKYISATLALLALFATYGLRRARRSMDWLPGVKRAFGLSAGILLLLLVVWCARLSTITPFRQWVLSIALCLMWLCMLLPIIRRWLFILLPIVLLVELSLYRPELPRKQENKAFGASLVSTLQGLTSGVYPDGCGRFLAMNTLLPPLYSSTVKLADIRSVSPLQLARVRSLSEKMVHPDHTSRMFVLPRSRKGITPALLQAFGVHYIVSLERIPDKTEERATTTEGLAVIRNGIIPHTVVQENRLSAATNRSVFGPNGYAAFSSYIPGDLLDVTISVSAEGPGKAAITVGKERREVFVPAQASWRLNLDDFLDNKVGFCFEVLEGTRMSFAITRAMITASPENQLKLAATDSRTSAYIYRYRDFKPYVRFAGDVVLLPKEGFAGLMDTFYHHAPPVPVYIEVPQQEPPPGRIASGTINRCFWRSPNSLDILLQVQTPGWLYVALADDGNWRARLHDRSLPIYRANGAFMALYIPDSGQKVVHLRYRPWSFFTGALLSLAGISVMLAGWLFSRKKTRA